MWGPRAHPVGMARDPFWRGIGLQPWKRGLTQLRLGDIWAESWLLVEQVPGPCCRSPSHFFSSGNAPCSEVTNHSCSEEQATNCAPGESDNQGQLWHFQMAKRGIQRGAVFSDIKYENHILTSTDSWPWNAVAFTCNHVAYSWLSLSESDRCVTSHTPQKHTHKDEHTHTYTQIP